MVSAPDLHINGYRISGPGQSGTSPEAIPSDGAQAFSWGEIKSF